MSNNILNLPLVMLDPSAIKTDASTYQFRAGGDAHGVTDKWRLRVERWDPVLHGDPILVHERLDGSYYVADGHHRLDLAQRLNAQGAGPGKISAMVLREADGYSPEDVRVIAAYKNMAKGHSDAVDGARVFKEARNGRVHTWLLPQLQMDKSNLRLSYSLSGLSDQALNQVEAGAVPVDMAAKVAERVPEDHRDSVISIIAYRLKQEYVSDVPSYATHVQVHSPLSLQVDTPSFAARFNPFQNSNGRSLH